VVVVFALQPSYSNTGFSYLGRFLESVAGATWEEYVASNVLKPLGMTNTMFDAPADLTDMGTLALVGVALVYAR
jgi:beta-lactamase class C